MGGAMNNRILAACLSAVLVYALLLTVHAQTPAGKRPKLPEITKPVMFDTPEADRILSALQVFPPNNPWNEDISKRPVLANSQQMIATIGKDKRLAYNLDMVFV